MLRAATSFGTCRVRHSGRAAAERTTEPADPAADTMRGAVGMEPPVRETIGWGSRETRVGAREGISFALVSGLLHISMVFEAPLVPSEHHVAHHSHSCAADQARHDDRQASGLTDDGGAGQG